MVALPRLKTDLHVEARTDVHGAYYRLTNADKTRSHRLSQPAYMALSMLDGKFGWEQWSTAVQTIYPQVTPAHMNDLLREVAAMNFLDGPLHLPGDPAPPAPPAAPTAPPPPGGPTMLSDLEAGFAGNNVPLEVTGIRQAFNPDAASLTAQTGAEVQEGLGAQLAGTPEMDASAFDALFTGTDDALAPQATQISAPPSEMEDPYLRELGPSAGRQAPSIPPAQPTIDDGAIALPGASSAEEQPGPTEEVRISLASDDLISDFSSEPPAPPDEISNPAMVAPSPFPDPTQGEGIDVQFTDHALPALPRTPPASQENTHVGGAPSGLPELSPDGSAIEGLPVALGTETTEGAPVLESLAPADTNMMPHAATGAEALFPQTAVSAEAAEANLISDVSTTVVVGDTPTPSASQDAIPTSTNVGAPTQGQPAGHPIAGALPPFDFDPQSNPDNQPIPGPSGSSQAITDASHLDLDSLPSLEGPAEPQLAPEAADAALASLMASEDEDAEEVPFDDVDSRVKPKVYPDLKSGPAQEVGLLSVTNDKGRTFQIYELEFQLLQLLDGERDLSALREEFGRRGQPVDEQQLASFIRQMNAYGFLESTGPITPATSLPPQMPWKEGPPQKADTIEQWPAEERRLFQQGLTHFRDNNFGRAEGYFNALLEINPDNPEAQAMLAMMAESPQVQAAAEAEAKADAAPQGSSSRTALLLFLLASTLIAGAGMAIERPVTSTAEVVIAPAPAVVVKTPIDGVVAERMVEPKDPVRANAPLLRLTADDLLPAEAANKVELATVARELELFASTDEQRATMKTEARTASKALAALLKQKKKLDRSARRGSRRSRKAAAQKAAALAPRIDEARATAEKAANTLKVATLGTDDKAVEAANARLASARAKEAELKTAREARMIAAPFKGVVDALSVAVGDALVAGGEVATVSPSGTFRSEVFVPENAMNLVEVGGYINIRMTAFPDETFPGKTVFIGDAVEVVDGDRGVRVKVELQDDTARLKPQMSGTVAFQGMTMPVTMIVWGHIRSWMKLNFFF